MKLSPPLPLGRILDAWWLNRFLPQRITLAAEDASSHVHVLGTSGSVKTRWLCQYYLGLIRAGIGLTLIDPHGDLSKLILSTVVAENNK